MPPRRKPKRAQATKRTATKADKLEAAYGVLGVDPAAVTTTPQISHVLSQLPGGIPQAITYLRGSDTDDARTWLSQYDDLPVSIRTLLPFEAICLATKLTTRRMLEVITGACFEQADVTSRLLAAASHPDVVTATVKSARTLKGAKDREMLHKHAKFLPIPKSQTTFVAPGAIGTQQNTQLNLDQRTQYAITEIANIERRQERISNRYNDEVLGLGESAPVPQLASGPDGPPPAPEAELVDPSEEEPGWDTL